MKNLSPSRPIDADFYNEEYFERSNYRGYTSWKYRLFLWIRFLYWGFIWKYAYGVRSVLEIGCATGEGVRVLRSVFHMNAYGVDISEYAVRKAHPSVQMYVQKADILNDEIPFQKKYDIIVSFDVLEHLDCKDVGNLIRRLARLSDMMFHHIYVTDSVVAWSHRVRGFIHKDHVCERDSDWWRRFFKSCGMEVKRAGISGRGTMIARGSSGMA